MIRRTDMLGRVVIPKETRDSLDIKIGDPLEIFIEENRVILSKYSPGCLFCAQIRNTIRFKGREICRDCAGKIKD